MATPLLPAIFEAISCAFSISFSGGWMELTNPHLRASSASTTRAVYTNSRANPKPQRLSLIHISEPTRLRRISYAVFCLKKKKKQNKEQKKNNNEKKAKNINKKHNE